MSRKNLFYGKQFAVNTLLTNYIARVQADGGTIEGTSNVSTEIENLDGNETLVMIPSGYKSGKLYSVIGNDFTFARSTIGYRLNELGAWEQVGINVPRLNWIDNKPQLSTESSHVNRFLNSDTLSTQNVTVTVGRWHYVAFYGSGSITFSDGFVATLNGVDANTRVFIVFQVSTTNVTCTVSGDVLFAQFSDYNNINAGGTSNSWNQPLSYISTTSSAVTVAQEELSAYITDSFTNQFTLYWEGVSYGINNNYSFPLISIRSADNTEAVAIHDYNLILNKYTDYIINGVHNYIGVSFNFLETKNKVVIKGSGTTIKIYLNGVLIQTRTDFINLTKLQQIRIKTINSQPWHETTQNTEKILFWNTEKSDADALTLSTI